jgi:hypothetical protein
MAALLIAEDDQGRNHNTLINDDFFQTALRDHLAASLTLVAQIQSVHAIGNGGTTVQPRRVILATSTDATALVWTQGTEAKSYVLPGIAVRIRLGHRDRVKLKLSLGSHGLQPEFDVSLRSWPNMDPKQLTQTTGPSIVFVTAPQLEPIGRSYMGKIASVEITYPSLSQHKSETLEDFFR